MSTSKIELLEEGKQANVDIDADDPGEEEVDPDQLEREKSRKRANFIRMLCMPGNEEDEDEQGAGTSKKGKKKPKPKAFLPHWVIYIAYTLIFVASGTAAFFVILYGFQFGKEKSDNWMKSMMLSFWQSVLVIQPVKVRNVLVLDAVVCVASNTVLIICLC